jgi:hypothetical protein
VLDCGIRWGIYGDLSDELGGMEVHGCARRGILAGRSRDALDTGHQVSGYLCGNGTHQRGKWLLAALLVALVPVLCALVYQLYCVISEVAEHFDEHLPKTN